MVHSSTMSTMAYKLGHIHFGPKDKVSASCLGLNNQFLKSRRAAKLWITRVMSTSESCEMIEVIKQS